MLLEEWDESVETDIETYETIDLRDPTFQNWRDITDEVIAIPVTTSNEGSFGRDN